MCPPATSSRPSDRNAKPAQKMFAPACVIPIFVFVDGFQSMGLSPWAKAGHHRTRPVGRSWAWTALYGQVVTDENCPTVVGFWALADEIAMRCAKAKHCRGINWTSNDFRERDQDFRARRKTRDCRSTELDIFHVVQRMSIAFFMNPHFFPVCLWSQFKFSQTRLTDSARLEPCRKKLFAVVVYHGSVVARFFCEISYRIQPYNFHDRIGWCGWTVWRIVCLDDQRPATRTAPASTCVNSKWKMATPKCRPRQDSEEITSNWRT